LSNKCDFSLLYIEDDEIIKKMVCNFLSRRFETFAIAKDGIDGLEQYRENPTNIVITDIEMPRLNGLELIEEIKKINPDVKVVIMTAFSNSYYLFEAIELGVEKYIKKPFTIDSLDSVLETILNDLRKEREFKKTKEHIDYITKIINEGIISFDRAKNITFINESAKKILNIDSSYIGKNIKEIVNLNKIEFDVKNRSDIWSISDNRVDVEYTTYELCKKDSNGIIVFKDRSSEINHKRELAKSEYLTKLWKKKYKIALDGTNDGFWDLCLATNTLTASKNFFQMLGYEKNEFDFEGFLELIHEKDREGFKSKLKASIESGSKYKNTFRIKAKDGTFKWILSKANLFLSEEREVKRLVGFNTDITKEKIYEKALREKSKKLQEINKNLDNRIKDETKKNLEKDRVMLAQSKLASMGELLSMIAHQWRQPLNAISLSIADLKIKLSMQNLDNVFSENTEVIVNRTQHLSNIIDGFMNFFKPDVDRSRFYISEAVNTVLKLINAQCKNQNITIVNECEEIEIYGYRGKLEQVILNILTNAKDAFEDSQIEKKELKLYTKDENKSTYIIIKDNAGGVDEDFINKVFEPYFTTKEEGKGTGIGLYISKAIIQKSFRGDIEVFNYENSGFKGAVFSIEIPKEI